MAALAAQCCLAQAPWPAAGQPSSRAEAIERERASKEATLTPEALPRQEQLVRQMRERRILEKVAEGYKGWRAVAGGLATGSGFAMGAEYGNHNIGKGYMELRAAAQVSTRMWQRYDGTLLFPQSFGKRLISAVNLTHRNYNSLDYYGPGNNSARGGRSNYRLEDTTLQGIAIARPEKRLRAGAMMGYVWTNVGPGRRAEISSTERTYSEAQAPGLHLQSDFFRYGLLAQYDRRDNPLGPKTGGNYVVQWVRYQDQTRGLYSFDRYDIDLQEYAGFFNNVRRLAFRARATLTSAVGGSVVPF